MNFLKKNSEKEFLLNVIVIPNSKKQTINFEENSVRITLTSPPTKNKANKELLKLLKKKFGPETDQIQLLSGLKSHDKIISLVFKEKLSIEQIVNKLR